MNKILDLREKRAKLWDSTKAFLDSRRNENGLLSAEDTATYEKMEADVVNAWNAKRFWILNFPNRPAPPLRIGPVSTRKREKPAGLRMSTKRPSGKR